MYLTIFQHLTFGAFITYACLHYDHGTPGSLFIFLPAIAVIMYLNITRTKICSECGKTIYNGKDFCPKCGNSLA